MRDYRIQINLESTDMIVNYALKKDCDVSVGIGVLNDCYIIHAEKKFSVNKVAPRDYIICYYEHQNTQSNTLYALLTDNYDRVLEYAKRFGVELN